MKTRDRNWSYVVKSQGASRIASKPQRLGRGKEEFIQSLRGSMALLTPSSPPATLDNTEFPAEHGAPSLSGPHLAGPPASDVSPVLIPRKFCSAFKTSSALLCEAFLSLLLPPHPLIPLPVGKSLCLVCPRLQICLTIWKLIELRGAGTTSCSNLCKN